MCPVSPVIASFHTSAVSGDAPSSPFIWRVYYDGIDAVLILVLVEYAL